MPTTKRVTKAAPPPTRSSKEKPAAERAPVGDGQGTADTDGDTPLDDEAPDPNPGLDGFK